MLLGTISEISRNEFLMKGNIWVISFVVLILLLIGFVFVFYTNKVRQYYYSYYKEGIKKTGLLTTWIDKYPGEWFFRLFGIISILFAILLITDVMRKK